MLFVALKSRVLDEIALRSSTPSQHVDLLIFLWNISPNGMMMINMLGAVWTNFP